MYVMQLTQPAPVETRPLQLVEREPPLPGPEYVRLRVRACGVCHTDLHIVEGELELSHLPVVPGHQVVGVVDALGEGVTRHRIGDRLGVPWLYQSCGVCRYCRSGRENLCADIRFTGVHADGGFGEWMVVHEQFAYPLPPQFDDLTAAPLLCAGVVGYRALRLSRVQSASQRGWRLGLYGFGASAHLVIQIAVHWGCEVFVFTRSPHHREMARQLGAAWVGSAEQDPGALMDSSIIFAPAGWLVPRALAHLDRGGVLVLGGIHMSPIPEMSYDLLWYERTVQSVANSTRQDVEEFLRLAAEVPLRVEVEPYPLRAANEVLLRLKRGEVHGAAVLQIEGR